LKARRNLNRQIFRKQGINLLCSAGVSLVAIITASQLGAQAADYLLLLSILIPLAMLALLDFWSAIFSYAVLLLAYLYIFPSQMSLPTFLSMLAVGGILSTLGYTFSSMKQKLKNITNRANLDSLTGAYSRHYGETLLSKELERSTRTPRATSLLVLDIDHFKQFNDTYGHQMGDKVLMQLVSVIELNLRASDTLIRWGGEEFCVILPKTLEDEAYVMAERLRAKIAKHSFSGVASVQVSIGLASSEPNDSVHALFKRADLMLYEAKKQGRNRVISYTNLNKAKQHNAQALRSVPAMQNTFHLVSKEH